MTKLIPDLCLLSSYLLDTTLVPGLTQLLRHFHSKGEQQPAAPAATHTGPSDQYGFAVRRNQAAPTGEAGPVGEAQGIAAEAQQGVPSSAPAPIASATAPATAPPPTPPHRGVPSRIGHGALNALEETGVQLGERYGIPPPESYRQKHLNSRLAFIDSRTALTAEQKSTLKMQAMSRTDIPVTGYNQQVADEEAARVQEQRDKLLGAQAESLEKLRGDTQKQIELAKEQMRLSGEKMTLRDVPTASIPGHDDAMPWDFSTYVQHGDGTIETLPGKPPAWVGKYYADAQAYSKAHPDVSVRDAWDKIMAGEVDLKQLRETNLQNTVANKKAGGSSHRGGSSGGVRGARTSQLDSNESEVLGAAGGDYSKAVDLLKSDAQYKKKFGKLYGPTLDRLRVGVHQPTKWQTDEERRKNFAKALSEGGKKGGDQKAAAPAAKPATPATTKAAAPTQAKATAPTQPKQVKVYKGKKIHNPKTGEVVQWDGSKWAPVK